MSTITTALLTSNRSIRSGIGNSIDPTGFIVRPYISDIHNGISNPNFTYTATGTIVPDENGILRRTPAGYPAVEGGRWAATVAEGALLGPELMSVPLMAGHVTITPNGIGGIFASTPTDQELYKNIGISANRWFQHSFEVYDYVSGGVKSAAGLLDNVHVITGNGIYTETILSIANVNMSIKTIGVTTLKVRNISVREVIPQWYAPTLGATRSISTRKGLRTIQTADTFKGMLIEPAMTNKVTARKSNPTDTTGVTGAGGATVTRVLDTAALTAGGYQDICTTVYDYELSIPQNGTISMAGAVANLNKHSVSLDMRLVSGIGVQLGLTGQTSDVTLTAAFSRQKKENLTPLAITDVITITNLNADTAVVRCILPGLEERAFCTSRIAPAADTAAAQTRAASVVSASTSGVFPMVSATEAQDFAIFMRVVPRAMPSIYNSVFWLANNGARIYYSPADAIAFYPGPGITNVYKYVVFTPGSPFELLVLKTTSGTCIKYRTYSDNAFSPWSTWASGTSDLHKLPTVIGSTYFMLNSMPSISQNYPLTSIIKLPPKATLAEYQTWIEAELTRRGLI